MNCRVCGKPLPAGVTYCPNCGTPTPAYYSSAGTAPDAPTVASAPSGITAPPPPTSYGPQPYGAAPPPPYRTLPLAPYDPYSVAAPPSPPPPFQRRGNRLGLLIGAALLVLVLVGGGLAAVLLRPGAQGSSPPAATTPPAQATATAQAHATATVSSALTATTHANATATASVIASNPDQYPPGGGKLVLYDSLSDNSKGYDWDVGTTADGTCAFTGGAYHASTPHNHFFYVCPAKATDFTNFAFEVQMQIRSGDCGGLIFRAKSDSGKFYFLQVCQDGSYHLYRYLDFTGTHSTVLAGGSSSAITTGLNQPNVLAVVAQGSTLDVYVNKQKIASVSESTFSHGQIGVVGNANSHPTEVVYSNAKVWMM